MKKVYIIILNYNNCEDTIDCVKSVKEINSTGLDVQVVVVDNKSTDESVEILTKELAQDTVFLQTEKNIGYAGGNNVGIKYAIENKADYVCVLNNDTIVSENFLVNCIDYLEKNEDVGIVGPTILEYKNMTVQSTGGDIILKKGDVTLKNNGKNIDELPDVIECDYVGGACMVFRTSLIESFGLIPECYFLFFEETEWCYKVRANGYKNVCISSAHIWHKGSASIEKINGLHAYLMERNRVVFVKRNSKNIVEYFMCICFMFIRNLYRGLFKGKENFSYMRYQIDGITGRVDYKKYPFIVINDD